MAELLALIHAEIDGELDGPQRSELARRLLSDPAARALRDELQQLCKRLDAVEQLEPPDQLSARILHAIPPSAARLGGAFRWPAHRLRYAALAAGVLVATAVVLQTVHGPNPASTDLAGTLASRGRVMLDTVRLDSGPVAGRVSLYREPAGLSLTFEVRTDQPVDVLIARDGHTRRVRVGPSAAGASTSLALPGFDGNGSRTLDLTFLASGHEVGRATLRVPDGG